MDGIDGAENGRDGRDGRAGAGAAFFPSPRGSRAGKYTEAHAAGQS